LFLFHKPRGLVTTNADPEGRPTIFAALPKGLPRLISVGRLDINSEGLLLLTNDGGLARVLELPATGWLRRYRVRALGRVTQEELDRLRGGITVEGVRYGPIEAMLDREQGANVWLTVGIREGKNREVRKVLETLGLTVNRLIRVAFGPFELGELRDGAVKEIESQALRTELGEKIVGEANADFDAPLIEKLDDRPLGKRPSPSAPLRGAPPSPRKRGEGGERHADKFTQSAQEKRREPGEGHTEDHWKKRTPHKRRDRSGGPRPKYPRPR
jgi:23S rRNA pseudouridine2605 synthase